MFRTPLARLGARLYPLQASATSTRRLATARPPPSSTPENEESITQARQWLTTLSPSTIPRNLCSISFSRSSGPGGQNVNKTSSKATLRLPLSDLLPLLPPLIHTPVRNSPYLASSSNDLVISSETSRKQADNLENCFRKLYQLIQDAGRAVVPGETSVEQKEKVLKLQKAEAAGRRKMKEMLGKKKAARRGGGGRDE